MNYRLAHVPFTLGYDIGEPLRLEVTPPDGTVPLTVEASEDGPVLVFLSPVPEPDEVLEKIRLRFLILKQGEVTKIEDLGEFLGSFLIKVNSPIVKPNGQKSPPKSASVVVFWKRVD